MRLTLQTDAAADADLAAENERAANLEPIRKFPVSKIRQQSDAMRDVAPVERRARRWRGCGAGAGSSLKSTLSNASRAAASVASSRSSFGPTILTDDRAYAGSANVSTTHARVVARAAARAAWVATLAAPEEM